MDKREELEEKRIESIKIEALAVKKDCKKIDEVIDYLLNDLDKKPTVSVESINILRGIHRDFLMALENFKRVNRMLFLKRGE